MSKPDYPPEFESQVRKAMDVPEPNANTMDALREQFVARGMTTLKTDLRADPASNPFRPEKDSTMKQKTSRLSPRLAAKFENKSFMTTLRTRPLVAIVLALLILLALTGVAYAIGKSLGYIPGIGLVNQDVPIRVLAEPVTTSHNGIIFTIMQIVADSERTTVFYSINAPQPTPGPLLQPIPGEPTCKFLPDFISHFIRLPDGQILNGGGGGPVIGNDSNLTYFKVIDAPIPQDVDTITVVLGCDQGEATVHLVPASSTEILPVITLPSAVPEMNAIETRESTESVTPTVVPNDFGFSLELEKVVELDDGYLLIGNMRWADINLMNVGISSEITTIVDANGNPVSFAFETTDPSFWELDSVKQRAGWAFKIAGKDHAWPIAISLKPSGGFLPVEASSFSIDLGPNPQTNQSWNLDIDVPVKNAGVIHVNTVTLLKGTSPLEDPNSYGLSFDITPASPIVTLMDKKHPNSIWGGGGGPEGYSTSFLYKVGFLPSGSLTITVMYSYPILSPNLQVIWQP